MFANRLYFSFFLSGWGWGASVMAISVVYFIFMDAIKVLIYKKWNFELTARLWPVKSRRQKLAQRLVQKAVDERVKINVSKVRRVTTMIRVARAFGGYQNLPEIEMEAPAGHH